MKRICSALIILLCLDFSIKAQNNVGINDDNSSPKASAMLDVFSTTKGLLIPRIALTASTTAAPVTTPEASLLIYNTATAGDVTPGYYYWDGTSKWVRLLSNADPKKDFNLVTKTANATLQKTENMVFASGDITLTLPAITSADDGLEISVKNFGTYMDVVTVVGATGSVTIDGSLSSALFKNFGITFVAKNGNWGKKENLNKPDNIFDVSANSSWTTIAQIIEFMGAHMTGPSIIRLGGGDYPVSETQTINLDYPLTIEGGAYGETTIEATAGVSGTPLFDCKTETYFKMIIFNGYANTTGNDALKFTSSGIYHEVKDCYFYGFNKGVVSTTNNDLWLFECDFENCAEAGIEIAEDMASGGSMKVSECDFTQCGKGIHLFSGDSVNISIQNCSFYNVAGNIGLLYVPATFTSFDFIYFTNNSWNALGTFVSGFDFTRPDGRDADAFFLTNPGMENGTPHCRISVNNNSTVTTVVTALSYVKALWVNTSLFTCKWTIENNRITYQPKNKTDAWAMITGNISVSKNSTVTLAIVKNGITTTRYGETDIRIATTNQPFQFSTVIFINDLTKDDFLELYVTAADKGNVTFQDVQWFTNTQ
ncbi:MAG: hypothetical protein WCI31_12535 [Prolixibacteraceae bacterium]